jgi:hypothetical protein
VKMMQSVLIFLFSLPVLLAQNYSLQTGIITAISALISVCLLIYAVCLLLANFERGTSRNITGLTGLSVLAIYFYAQFLSYYLQGSYFNQQFFYHANIRSLIETWSVYYPLIFLFFAWIACIWGAFLFLGNRELRCNYSSGVLSLMVIVAVLVDPGLRGSIAAKLSSLAAPKIVSLERIEWDRLDLNRNALGVRRQTILDKVSSDLRGTLAHPG